MYSSICCGSSRNIFSLSITVSSEMVIETNIIPGWSLLKIIIPSHIHHFHVKVIRLETYLTGNCVSINDYVKKAASHVF